LEFLAVVISRTTGYVALNDIKILNGACPPARVCDFEDPSICGYQNDAQAEFTWTRHQGATPSPTPSTPHPHPQHPHPQDRMEFVSLKSIENTTDSVKECHC
jgi:hypothetical protein